MAETERLSLRSIFTIFEHFLHVPPDIPICIILQYIPPVDSEEAGNMCVSNKTIDPAIIINKLLFHWNLQEDPCLGVNFTNILQAAFFEKDVNIEFGNIDVRKR